MRFPPREDPRSNNFSKDAVHIQIPAQNLSQKCCRILAPSSEEAALQKDSKISRIYLQCLYSLKTIRISTTRG